MKSPIQLRVSTFSTLVLKSLFVCAFGFVACKSRTQNSASIKSNRFAMDNEVCTQGDQMIAEAAGRTLLYARDLLEELESPASNSSAGRQFSLGDSKDYKRLALQVDVLVAGLDDLKAAVANQANLSKEKQDELAKKIAELEAFKKQIETQFGAEAVKPLVAGLTELTTAVNAKCKNEQLTGEELMKKLSWLTSVFPEVGGTFECEVNAKKNINGTVSDVGCLTGETFTNYRTNLDRKVGTVTMYGVSKYHKTTGAYQTYICSTSAKECHTKKDQAGSYCQISMFERDQNDRNRAVFLRWCSPGNYHYVSSESKILSNATLVELRELIIGL